MQLADAMGPASKTKTLRRFLCSDLAISPRNGVSREAGEGQISLRHTKSVGRSSKKLHHAKHRAHKWRCYVCELQVFAAIPDVRGDGLFPIPCASQNMRRACLLPEFFQKAASRAWCVVTVTNDAPPWREIAVMLCWDVNEKDSYDPRSLQSFLHFLIPSSMESRPNDNKNW